MRDGCEFCDYDGPSPILYDFRSVFVIEPVDPIVPGHVLVIPRQHVADFSADPIIAAMCMAGAADYAEHRMDDCNLITSKGLQATQTIMHLHLHLIPRRQADGIVLPWTK